MSKTGWRRTILVIQCRRCDPAGFDPSMFLSDVFSLLCSRPGSRPYVLSFSLFPDPWLLLQRPPLPNTGPLLLRKTRGQTALLTKQPCLCSETRSALQAEQVKLLQNVFFLPQFQKHRFASFSQQQLVTALRLNSSLIEIKWHNAKLPRLNYFYSIIDGVTILLVRFHTQRLWNPLSEFPPR